jgi:hypothetical protein
MDARFLPMPSPFPGMNPYFEQTALWLDFHSEFLMTVRHLLIPTLGDSYIVQLEHRIYIHDVPPESRRLVGRADVFVADPRKTEASRSAVAVLEPPAEVQLPQEDEERVRFLEIRDRKGRELVTVIELLSPSNKRPGDDREQYLTKRREVLRNRAHLVEIDLLRGWTPMPMTERPPCDYSVLVSRTERRPIAGFWAIHLRDRLTVIPIPLRAEDSDSRLDLQEALHLAYDRAGYARVLYDGSPEPPLSAADAKWAESFAPAAP